MADRPLGRKKNVTGGGQGVHVTGKGSGSSVGGGQGGIGKTGGGSGGGRNGGSRGPGGLSLIIIILVLLLGGGGGLGSLLGGGGSSSNNSTNTNTNPNTNNQSSYNQGGQSGYSGGGSASGQSSGSGYSFYDLISGMSGMSGMSGSGSSGASAGGSFGGWTESPNVRKLDTSVSPAARDRFTTIKGNKKDVVTIMVYMCGTDLESRSGMATSDLSEMQKATIGDNVNLIVFTGGCRQWKNNIISNKYNQIYQVTSKGVKCLTNNAGDAAMTNPDNLTAFIQYCAKYFPANRNELIFWDHGGGSVSGYGYDEKNQRAGSMDLAKINKALKAGGVKFDFIGFDACLMATAETGLLLSDYADYMIASEETEPGVGWYYTDWLTSLSANTSMPTIEIGKNIADSFVTTCASKCRGQSTTLSVVDLAELGETLKSSLSAFSKDTVKMIQNNEYAAVSSARSGAREFAQSTRIDQIDLVHFASNLGTDAGKKLTETILSAVKYNNVSSNMTNCYGLSAYFPYRKTSNVDQATKINDAIGMDSDYTDCIRAFASMEVSGQIASGGTASPYSSLFGSGSSSSSQGLDADAIGSLLGAFLGGDMSSISGLSGSNTGFFGKSLDMDAAAAYVADNQFDASKLVWTDNGKGQKVISLTEDQWALVQGLDLSMYYKTDDGYLEMGLDNVFDFDDSGSLLTAEDNTWLSINGQPVAYYHMDTIQDGDNYTITGYVPVLLNGDRMNLILCFDQDHEDGYILGAKTVYDPATETATEPKGLTELKAGDKLTFLADLYTEDGEFTTDVTIGNVMKVTDNMVISNTDVGGETMIMYRFTDIYNQNYWSDPIE